MELLEGLNRAQQEAVSTPKGTCGSLPGPVQGKPGRYPTGLPFW